MLRAHATIYLTPMNKHKDELNQFYKKVRVTKGEKVKQLYKTMMDLVEYYKVL